MSIENGTCNNPTISDSNDIFSHNSMNSSLATVTSRSCVQNLSQTDLQAEDFDASQQSDSECSDSSQLSFESATSTINKVDNTIGSLSAYASNIENLKVDERDAASKLQTQPPSPSDTDSQSSPCSYKSLDEAFDSSVGSWYGQGIGSLGINFQQLSQNIPRPAPTPPGKSNLTTPHSINGLSSTPSHHFISPTYSKPTNSHSSDTPTEICLPPKTNTISSSPFFSHHRGFSLVDLNTIDETETLSDFGERKDSVASKRSNTTKTRASQQRHEVYNLNLNTKKPVFKNEVSFSTAPLHFTSHLPGHSSPTAELSPHSDGPINLASLSGPKDFDEAKPQQDLKNPNSSQLVLKDKGKIERMSSFTVNLPRLEDYTNLTYLDLSISDYTKSVFAATGRLPRWIKQCTALEYLIGTNLPITVVDEWVSQCLIKLRVIRLNDNQISTWPDHLAQLLPYDMLTVVDLEGNPCFNNFCERYPQFAIEYAKCSSNHKDGFPKQFSASEMSSSSPRRSLGLNKRSSKPTNVSKPSLVTTSLPFDVSAPESVGDLDPMRSTKKMESNSSGFFGRKHRKANSLQVQGKLSRLSLNHSSSNLHKVHVFESKKNTLPERFPDISEPLNIQTNSKSEITKSNLHSAPTDKSVTNTTLALSENEPEKITSKDQGQVISGPYRENNEAGFSNFNISATLDQLNGEYVDDSSEDDDALTSLEPIAHKLMRPEFTSPPCLGPPNDRGSETALPSASTSSSSQQFNINNLTIDVSDHLLLQLNNQVSPDVWAQKRIEPSEIEKSKLVLNLLRDIWEMSTSNILQPEPNLSATAVASNSDKRKSVGSGSLILGVSGTQYSSKRNSIQSIKEIETPNKSEADIGRKSILSSLARGASKKLKADDMSGRLDTQKHASSSQSNYYDESNGVPSRRQVIEILSRFVDDEKTFVKKMGEFMTIYVKSKKCPPKVTRMFNDIPQINKLHSGLLLPSLQKCLEGYNSSKDPQLEKLSSLVLTNIDEFRIYILYEISVDESIRMFNFWKRLSRRGSDQSMVSYGTAVPSVTSYQHPDAIISEWIQKCHGHKLHSLPSVSDYLQLPTEHLWRYRSVLKTLSSVSPDLEKAYKRFNSICKQVEQEKMVAAEERRVSEFENLYNLSAYLPERPACMSKRKYFGDAVVQLKSEIYLELPSKQYKPDTIHYVSPLYCTYGFATEESLQNLATDKNASDAPNSSSPDSKEESTDKDSRTDPSPDKATQSTSLPAPSSSSYNSANMETPFTVYSYSNQESNYANKSYPTWCRSNPVSKVVQKKQTKSRFNLVLHRVIIFDDVVVITNEDKKKVLCVVSRDKIEASLPWKFPIREGPEAYPTGDQVSLKSKSSANSIYTTKRNSGSSTTSFSNTASSPFLYSSAASSVSSATSGSTSLYRNGSSGGIRLIFRDDPKIWYCTLRSLHCGKSLKNREQRVMFVDLFTGF